MADPLKWFRKQFTQVTPKNLADLDDFYAHDMRHFTKDSFIDGLLRKYFSRGDLLQRGSFAFWNAPGVDRRSATLGYTMDDGVYAKPGDQVLFYGNLPALVFDMEARRAEEDRIKPIRRRSYGSVRDRAKLVTNEWKSKGYPTILRDTEDYDIRPITGIFGTQHHRWGYTIGARYMNPYIVLPSYLLIFLDAFKKGGELAGKMTTYIPEVLKGIWSGNGEDDGAIVIVVAKGYTKPKDRKVLGLFYVGQE